MILGFVLPVVAPAPAVDFRATLSSLNTMQNIDPIQIIAILGTLLVVQAVRYVRLYRHCCEKNILIASLKEQLQNKSDANH